MQIHQDSKLMNEYSGKPKSPSFRRQEESMRTKQNIEPSVQIQNPSRDAYQDYQVKSYNRPTSGRPNSNPSFNNNSNTDGHFQLNDSTYMQQVLKKVFQEIIKENNN